MAFAKRWNRQQFFLSVLIPITLLIVSVGVSNCYSTEKRDGETRDYIGSRASEIDELTAKRVADEATKDEFESRPQSDGQNKSSTKNRLDERELNFILDDQDGYKICDPRIIFTDERLATAFNMIDISLDHMNDSLKLPYILRTAIELGRKVYSRLPTIVDAAKVALAHGGDKNDDDSMVDILPSKVGEAILMAIDKANEADFPNQSSSANSHKSKKLMLSDDDLSAYSKILLRSMAIVGRELAFWLIELSDKGENAMKQAGAAPDKFIPRLYEAFAIGLRQMMHQIDSDHENEVKRWHKDYIRSIYKGMVAGFKDKIKGEAKLPGKSYKSMSGKVNLVRGFVEPNKIVGPFVNTRIWNRYLFTSLTSPERLLKVLSGTLKRIRGETRQHDFTKDYLTEITFKFHLTLNDYVKKMLQYNNNDFNTSSEANSSVAFKKFNDLQEHENKVPAVCFTTGRRWRLILSRGATFQTREKLINSLIEEMSKARFALEDILGSRLCTLCLSRLEAGWRGWGINGEEKATDVLSMSSIETWMELKEMLGDNPIQLKGIKNPFAAGAIVGFDLGSKIGYNSARNRTLELERSDRLKSSREDKLKRIGARAGMMEGAKRAFDASVAEGYKVGLKLSPNAGIITTRRAASAAGKSMGTTLGANFGSVAGRMAGAKAEGIVDEGDQASILLQIAQAAGEQAGSEIGAIIGASSAIMAASDAYIRLVLSRGKLNNARFFFNEYTSGAKAGFETGLKGGALASDSVVFRPSAPTYLNIGIPEESDIDQMGNFENSGDDVPIDMPKSALSELEQRRNVSSNEKEFKGLIKLKFGEKEETFNLSIKSSGYVADKTVYGTLNGTASGKGRLIGYLFGDLLKNDGTKLGTTAKTPTSPTPST